MRPMYHGTDEYEQPVDEQMKRNNADLAGDLDHLGWEENDSLALLEGDHVAWFTSPWSKMLDDLPEDEDEEDDDDADADDIYDPEWDEYNSMDDDLPEEDDGEDDEDFSYPVVPLSAQRCLMCCETGTLDLSGDCTKCGHPGDFLG